VEDLDRGRAQARLDWFVRQVERNARVGGSISTWWSMWARAFFHPPKTNGSPGGGFKA
jgi:hypothetical protein